MTTQLRTDFLIDGRWTRASGSDRFVSVSSITGAVLGESAEADRQDVDTAVTAARRASDSWRGSSADERAIHLYALADAIEKRTEELSSLIAEEVGSTAQFAVGTNCVVSALLLRYYADLVRTQQQEDVRPSAFGHSIVRRSAVRVAALIIPWNYPVISAVSKLAAALAAGTTVVLKPSPESTLSTYLLAEAVVDSGMPPGVINIVPAGREVSEYLVTHPGIDKVSFTGSTPVGRRIAGLCGELLRPVTLELGGKSAAVLLDDVSLESFLPAMINACFANNGQTCTNNTRILAPRSRYQEVLDAVTDTVAAYRVGDPRDETTDIGPVVSAAHRDRIEGYIRAGIADGALVTTGGSRPTALPDGFYVAPTVFGNATPEMSISKEEIFGPVVTVLPYDDGDSGAVLSANDSEYGLAGSVWSSDQNRALAVARQIETGLQGINSPSNLDFGAPFGGWKASGLGVELGPEGLNAFLNLSTFAVPTPLPGTGPA